jgi:autotransporter-associated beta strand protein
MSNKRYWIAIAIFITVLASAHCTWAVSGTWTAGGQTAVPVNNTWRWTGTAPDFTDGNWVGGVMADGIDSVATFSLDVAAGVPQPVDIDYPVVVGSMTFSDTNNATAGGWVLNNIVDPSFGVIYLSVTTTNTPPMSTITVNDLGAGAEVKINAPIWGVAATDGLIKAGSGTLNLSQTNLYTGGTTVNAGTLKLTAGDNTLGGVDPSVDPLNPTRPTGAITVNGTLDLGGFSQTTSGAIVLNGNVQNGTLVNATTSAAPYDARSGTISANLSEVSGSPVGLTKTTGGTMILSGTNTYTGGTIISGGELGFDNPAALPASGLITINTGGVLHATGAYATAQAWLSSGKIDTTSTGNLALVADEASVNFTGYSTLSLGAVGTVNFTGTITPSGTAYHLGGGGTLVIAGTNALSDDGLTPRSLTIDGGTVNLTGSNNFTGGTTLNNGVLRVGSDASLGGPNTQLTLNGGQLAISGNGFTLDNRNLNWSTFNGGFYIDPGVTFTLNKIVTDGVNFSKSGPGTFNIAGGYTLSKEVALNEGVVNITDGASLTGAAMDFFNGGGSGNLTLGTIGGTGVTTLRVIGNDGDYWNTGYIKLGGGGGIASIDMYGNNTTLQADHFISFGEWDSGSYSMTVNDAVLLKTQHIYIADWGTATATVNLNNNSRVEASDLNVGSSNSSNPSGHGILNVNNNSSIAVGSLIVSNHGARGDITIKDHAVVYAGQIFAGYDDYWSPGVVSNVLIAGNANVNVVTSATMPSGFVVTGSGDFNVGNGGGGNNIMSTVTITDNAVVNVANNLVLGGNDSSAVVNVSGNAQLNVTTGIRISNGGWNQPARSLNISNSAQVTTPLVTIGDNGSSATCGWLNLNGGTLSTAQIVSGGSGQGSIAFNGGTLQATADSATFLQGLRNATIQAGGAIIDTNGHDITIAQVMTEAVVNTGNVTKKGAGTLTFTGALQYQGLTDVQDGTVKISTGVATQIGNVGGAGTLDVENATSLNAFSVNVGNVTIGGASSLTTANVGTNTLTIGPGSSLTINAIPGGPTAGGGLTAVPEPSTFAMLAIAAFGLAAAAWRRRK